MISFHAIQAKIVRSPQSVIVCVSLIIAKIEQQQHNVGRLQLNYL